MAESPHKIMPAEENSLQSTLIRSRVLKWISKRHKEKIFWATMTTNIWKKIYKTKERDKKTEKSIYKIEISLCLISLKTRCYLFWRKTACFWNYVVYMQTSRKRAKKWVWLQMKSNKENKRRKKITQALDEWTQRKEFRFFCLPFVFDPYFFLPISTAYTLYIQFIQACAFN